MIKLHASYGLKVPAEQDYSSQNFHASAEIELGDSAAQNPERLRQALHGLWHELKLAVSQEINGTATTPANTDIASGGSQPTLPAGGNSNSNGQKPQTSITPASRKQIGFLLSLARRNKNMSADQLRQWLRTEHNADLDNLSKQQATQLIDQLKE